METNKTNLVCVRFWFEAEGVNADGTPKKYGISMVLPSDVGKQMVADAHQVGMDARWFANWTGRKMGTVKQRKMAFARFYAAREAAGYETPHTTQEQA